MIVPMERVYAAVSAGDRERLLAALRDLEAMHLEPVSGSGNPGADPVSHATQRLERAAQILDQTEPSLEPPPDLPGAEAAKRVLQLEQRIAENRKLLDDLAIEARKAAVWGDVDLDRLRALGERGVMLRIVSQPRSAPVIPELRALAELRSDAPKRKLVLAVNPPETLPEGCEVLPVPARNLRQIGEAASRLEEEVAVMTEELKRLAHLRPRVRQAVVERDLALQWERARSGGHSDGNLFALRGWVPRDVARELESILAERGISCAVVTMQPDPDDEPPTRIEPPRWTQPIRGLFEMLGTVPGYREFDVSGPFMIALPLFAAVLIGDGGYGALIAIVPLLMFRKMAARMGRDFTVLVVVMGVTSICWGLISSNFFGYRLYEPLIPVDLTEYSRNLMMMLSFVMGALHLSLAQLWQAATFYPDRRFIGRIGWAVFIWGMYGVVQYFVLGGELSWHTPWPYLLSFGAALAILFARSDRNLLKAVALGLAEFPLSMISAFSDVISYVRLMAVGLATTVLAIAFNEMAAGLSPWPLSMLLWVFGHGLNIGLVLIAIFAHGVRLNMLEFSSNLGMQWSGYPFRPFGAPTTPQLR